MQAVEAIKSYINNSTDWPDSIIATLTCIVEDSEL